MIQYQYKLELAVCGDAYMRADFNKCETREMIGCYKGGKCINDIVQKLLTQVSGAGGGQRSADAKLAAEKFVNGKAVNDFIAVNVEDGRDDEGHFYWLARITRKGCTAPNDYTSMDGVKFTKGGAVVDVQWYRRSHAASDGLLFKPEQLAVATLNCMPRASCASTKGWRTGTTRPTEPKTKCWDMSVGINTGFR